MISLAQNHSLAQTSSSPDVIPLFKKEVIIDFRRTRASYPSPMDMENKFFDSNFFGIGFSALSSDLGLYILGGII